MYRDAAFITSHAEYISSSRLQDAREITVCARRVLDKWNEFQEIYFNGNHTLSAFDSNAVDPINRTLGCGRHYLYTMLRKRMRSIHIFIDQATTTSKLLERRAEQKRKTSAWYGPTGKVERCLTSFLSGVQGFGSRLFLVGGLSGEQEKILNNKMVSRRISRLGPTMKCIYI